MRCELVAEVPVACFAVFAEMARLERRPELGALCRASRAAGGRLDAHAVEQALPGVSAAGRDNIVAWCQMIGLCDARGALTAIGQEAADRDEAPVPEQGVFDLWVARHPLLGTRILHVARVKPTRDGRFDMIAPLPLEPDRDRVFPSVVDSTARWVLRGLPANSGTAGCLQRPAQARCRIRWTIDFSAHEERFRLEGALDQDGQRRAFQHAPEPSGIDLARLRDQWTDLYLSRFGRWTAPGRLSVPVDGLSDAAQESFSQSYPLGEVQALNAGAYSGVELRDVPIGPSTKSDADRWACQRFERRLRGERGYRTRGDLRRLFASVVEGTPLEPHHPALPAHTTLLRKHDAEPELLFAIAAPVDLSPFEVDAAELDAFAVADVPAPPQGTNEGVVRIPHRGTWTMLALVERLLRAREPRRALLCDRYIRTPQHLEALRLLHASIKERHPDTKLDVVTEAAPDADNIGAIRGVTGIAPRLYKDLFGGARADQPHARYLLVQPADGEGFGWQMDNSPLDARLDPGATPRSPLRWRDFGAFRLETGELPDALQRWFRGGVR
ncbi:hypothetical protein [Sorangium sp. So ce388]|uniref:hypothetical protein n=1 Tax=Sorangium sp. So ce388 TaxID=3133309 RepID=UPI003F5B00D0